MLRSLRPFVFALLAALVFAASRRSIAVAEESGSGTPAASADSVPAVLSRVPADVPLAALEARLHGTVSLRARVSRHGLVDSVVVQSGDPRLRESAIGSARWWIFSPPAAPTWTNLAIEIDGREEADPLTPDVLVMERDAVRRGAPWEAIDACSGELQRIGKHPRLQNEWPIRDRAIRFAERTRSRLKVPGAMMTECIGHRARQLRTMARGDHQEMIGSFDRTLVVCPWWADGYQWRAASLLQVGRGIDAMRTLVLFRAAAEDSAARALADRAIAQLATGDSLGVSQMLIREGKQFNLDEDAHHR